MYGCGPKGHRLMEDFGSALLLVGLGDLDVLLNIIKPK